ncbi:RRQRL motif-containing zinc-binding protein [Nocardia sp. NPDC050697]|uniref:RRQRL motif-containing zinc-binding protein n=1 Tax=Nocardia sp. NPDC050697 TaxID=3155158 RepID=UPI0033DF3B61
MSTPVYRWRCAPSHLRTRRQLSAAGLRPAGQDIAAVLRRQRRGRVLVAHLYDVNLAAPKRPATAAQLAALAKATAARQQRAAERRGIDLSAPDDDPGTGWPEPDRGPNPFDLQEGFARGGEMAHRVCEPGTGKTTGRGEQPPGVPRVGFTKP